MSALDSTITQPQTQENASGPTWASRHQIIASSLCNPPCNPPKSSIKAPKAYPKVAGFIDTGENFITEATVRPGVGRATRSRRTVLPLVPRHFSRIRSRLLLAKLITLTLYCAGLLPSVLAAENTDAISSPSTPLPQEFILPTNTKLGWPFGPGWPPFDGWPFVMFGILLAAATLGSAMSKKTNTALVSGIGMAVSAFLGFTILNDKTTAPTVTWTMVAIELFYASFYAIVHWRKYNMAEGCQLAVLALTFMIALILVTAFSDSRGQGVSKQVVACFVPPSFSISLLLCRSWSKLFGPGYVGPYHGENDKFQGVSVTWEEEGRAPWLARSDTFADDGRMVDSLTRGSIPRSPYSPRPLVKNQQNTEARRDGRRL